MSAVAIITAVDDRAIATKPLFMSFPFCLAVPLATKRWMIHKSCFSDCVTISPSNGAVHLVI